MKTLTCKQCSKQFTHETQAQVDQALRMHVARSHSRTLLSPNERSSKSGNRSALDTEQKDFLLNFIRERHKEFQTKTECFTQALEAAGVPEALKASSTNVQRYFQQAYAQVQSSPAKILKKRPYTRRAALNPAPLTQEVQINFCPQCGCNIHAIARGMVLAGHVK